MTTALNVRETSDPARCAWQNCRFPASSRMPFTLCDDHVLLIVSLADEIGCRPLPGSRPERANIGNVYYVRIGDHLKVGYAANLARRINQYPPGTDLLAAHPGTLADERTAHSMLTVHRIEGREWYALNDETRRFVADVVARYGPPPRITGRRRAGASKHTMRSKEPAHHVS